MQCIIMEVCLAVLLYSQELEKGETSGMTEAFRYHQETLGKIVLRCLKNPGDHILLIDRI